MTARQGHAAGARKCKVSMSIIIRHAGLLTGNDGVLVCARGMRLAVNIQGGINAVTNATFVLVFARQAERRRHDPART